MNSGLATFAILMIVLGATAGFYPVSILGLILLIAALIVPSRRPPRIPRPTVPEPRRTAPRPAYTPPSPRSFEPEPQPQAPARQPQPAPAVSTPQPTTFAGALFPTVIFPFMNPVTPVQEQAEKRQQEEKGEPKDEILEIAALAVFLRLLSR